MLCVHWFRLIHELLVCSIHVLIHSDSSGHSDFSCSFYKSFRSSQKFNCVYFIVRYQQRENLFKQFEMLLGKRKRYQTSFWFTSGYYIYLFLEGGYFREKQATETLKHRFILTIFKAKRDPFKWRRCSWKSRKSHKHLLGAGLLTVSSQTQHYMVWFSFSNCKCKGTIKHIHMFFLFLIWAVISVRGLQVRLKHVTEIEII